MELQVNGRKETLGRDAVNIDALLGELNVKQAQYVSVELNGSFVDRNKFETTYVKDGDKVEFLYFMGGGQ